MELLKTKTMKRNAITAIMAVLITIIVMSLYDTPKHHWSRSGSDAYLSIKGSIQTTDEGDKWYIKSDNTLSEEEIKCCYTLGIKSIWAGEDIIRLEK